MKFCPYCGTQLEDDMLFCNKCGKPFPIISDQTKNQTNEPNSTNNRETHDNQVLAEPPKKKSTGRTIIILLLLAVLCYWGWNGYKAWKASNDAEQAENNYNSGISYYDKGQYRNALDCFEKAGSSFPNIEVYKILCEGHLYKYLSESEVSTLCKNVDFLDTKDLLLSNDEIALLFLDGYWNSKDEKYYFEVYSDKENTHSMYNLPAEQPEDSEYFTIYDGVYYLHSTSNGDVEIFRFTILSKDRIMVFCYKDSSRIELSRQK